MEALLPTHPESNTKLLKRSFDLYRASFSKVILFAFLSALIIFIPRLIVNLFGTDIFFNVEPLSPLRLSLILFNALALLFFIAILWNMHCVIKRIHEPLADDLRVGLKKVFYVFVAAVIQNIIIFAVAAILLGLYFLVHTGPLFTGRSLLGTLFISVVFIGQFILLAYVATLFYFFVPLIAIENKTIFAAIEHSILLVWNHWWRTISLQAIPWISYLVTLILIKMLTKVDLHLFFTNYLTLSFPAILLNILVLTLFLPWAASVLLVQLKDLELRRIASGKLLRHEKRDSS